VGSFGRVFSVLNLVLSTTILVLKLRGAKALQAT
jgi:hypothetical protein